ncbi:MAG: hypothetical protein ABW039_02500 [Sphingobium sp.]
MSKHFLTARAPIILALLPLAACTTATAPVEVTRFHVGDPTHSGTIAVEEMMGNPDVGLEFATYANAVTGELQRVGFRPAGADSAYVARIGFRRSFRPTGTARDGRPVSVGVGGGVGSGGYSGLGVGIGINLSGRPKDIVTTELAVQIRRRGDATAIWEGRAMSEAKEGSPASQPGAAATRLAAALLQGYPGESGRSIRVK